MSGSLTPTALARLLGQWNLGAAPAYRELADVVRLLVLDGRIPLDTALPSERTLSATLARQPHHRDGGLCQPARAGFPEQRPGQPRPDLPARGPRTVAGNERDARAGLSRGARTGGSRRLIDLAYASLPASGEVVHRAFAAALTELPALLPGFGYDALGVPALREAIAGRYTAAGVPTTAEQILVTSGAQHALNIVLRTLVGRQDKVLVEHPTLPERAGCHPGGRLPDRSGGPAAACAASGRLGSSTPLESALMQQRPRMAYMVPDFHNPTGPADARSQRRRLVRAAAASGTVLVVDETLRELNLDGGTAAPAGRLQSGRGVHRIAQQVPLGRHADRAGSARRRPDSAVRRRPDHHGSGRARGGAARGSAPGAQPDGAAARPGWPRSARTAPRCWNCCRPPAAVGGGTARRRPGRLVPAARAEQHGPDRDRPGASASGSPPVRASAWAAPSSNFLRMPFTLPPDQLETAVLALRSAQDRLDAAPQLRRTLRNSPAVAIA